MAGFAKDSSRGRIRGPAGRRPLRRRMWQWQLRTLAGWRLDRPSRRPKVHAEDATCMENPPAEDRLRSAKDCNCTRPADKRTIGGFLNLANDCRNLHCDENWGPISENYHRTFRKTGKNYENCKVEVRCEENDRTVFPKLWRVSRSVLSVHRILAIFAFFFMVIPPQCSASFDGQVLPWRHYYRVLNQWVLFSKLKYLLRALPRIKKLINFNKKLIVILMINNNFNN